MRTYERPVFEAQYKNFLFHGKVVFCFWENQVLTF